MTSSSSGARPVRSSTITARPRKLQRRQEGQPAQIVNIAWRAQRRLHARWRQLRHARHKPNSVVAVAIARELAGFCWEIALAD